MTATLDVMPRTSPSTTTIRTPQHAGDVRPWSVMHATEHVRDVLDLAEAQRALGMRPVLVTPAGYGSIDLYLRTPQVDADGVSLLGTWQEVRQWRKSLDDCGAAAAMDVVHTHCFAAGMSGVRNWPVVVYDLRDCVEHDADANQQWLARSLRVAEQFVLARAEAVVVHWPSMRAVACERGAADEHIFVVPDAVTEVEPQNHSWLQPLRLPQDAVTFFATAVQAADLDVLLSAFAQVASEIVNTVLLLEAEDPASAALRNKLSAAGISRAVRLILPQHRVAALHGVDVVLTGSASRGSTGSSAASAPHRPGLEAMRSGRALLAADTIANRDLSPEGRGCLWYKPGDARDLAGRASFLARNPDFRRSLGASARAYLSETCSPDAVARRYDAVYRHAFARRRDGSQNPFGRLHPLQAAF